MEKQKHHYRLGQGIKESSLNKMVNSFQEILLQIEVMKHENHPLSQTDESHIEMLETNVLKIKEIISELRKDDQK